MSFYDSNNQTTDETGLLLKQLTRIGAAIDKELTLMSERMSWSHPEGMQHSIRAELGRTGHRRKVGERKDQVPRWNGAQIGRDFEGLVRRS